MTKLLRGELLDSPHVLRFEIIEIHCRYFHIPSSSLNPSKAKILCMLLLASRYGAYVKFRFTLNLYHCHILQSKQNSEVDSFTFWGLSEAKGTRRLQLEALEEIYTSSQKKSVGE